VSTVRISRLHFPVTTLGPGRRVGLWFQGCSIRCPGCISPDTWDVDVVAPVAVDAVLEAIEPWTSEADGLTVSGGEPFDQPDALATLLTGWRARHGGTVLVFTGYERDQVEPWLAEHPDLIDALVSGPFDLHADQTLALRGSDNQMLHRLTPAGAIFSVFERPADSADRRLDLMFDEEGGAWFAGIPARGDFQRFRQAMRRSGHRVDMTARTAGAGE
jgi:anaerobic ribonucleoside-triphosphate reductase activating protein